MPLKTGPVFWSTHTYISGTVPLS